jgi:hypothetical protein
MAARERVAFAVPVGLSVEEVRYSPEGLEVTLRRSKADQEEAGHTKAIPYAGTPACAPCARSGPGWT